jgi:hypothetical protein
MIDVISMKASQEASFDGSLVNRAGIVGLNGPSHSDDYVGTLTFPEIAPPSFARWVAAEVVGHYAHDSVRVRFTDGTRTLYLDDADMTFKDVADSAAWDDEWTRPDLLSSLDLWTARRLGLIIRLVRTDFDRDPRVTLVRVLLDIPTWRGAVHSAVSAIVALVKTVEPVLVHSETLSEETSQWQIGEPYSEQGFQLTELVQVTVDGDHKSASLSAGVVTLVGDSVPAGSDVEIAVKYRPQSTVRRVAGVRTLNRTPAWISSNLVVSGGLNGLMPRIGIGGYTVEERRIELRITVQGVAEGTSTAFEMRAALQGALKDGLTIDLPSGRSVTAQLDGFVEVVDTDPMVGNLPMAAGVVQAAFVEFVGHTQVRRARDDDGLPITTQVDFDFGTAVGTDLDTLSLDDLVEC